MDVIGNLSKLDRIPPKGRVYRYRKLLFWAQGGCICIEDMRNDGEFKVVTRAEFAARVIAKRAEITQRTYKYADERNEDENFVVNGCAAVKEGKKQGDPFDPEVLRIKMQEWRNSRILLGDGSGNVVGTHYLSGGGARSQSERPHTAAVLPPLPVKDCPNPESMRKEAAP